MPACESDSGIRESQGRDGGRGRYKDIRRAYREHLRETACREDNLEIRKSSNNEDKRGPAKGRKRKECYINEWRAY